MSDVIIIIIPARMGSTRPPGKPLTGLDGRPMIVEVAMRGAGAGMGRAVVGTDAVEFASVVEATAFDVVMTSARSQSGSDRIFEAWANGRPLPASGIYHHMRQEIGTLYVAVS